MYRRQVVRHVCLLILLLSAPSAFAQGPPPPPPPPLVPLPPPPQPPGNPVTGPKANLGKALFWDEQLSSTRTMACGSCHQPRGGGADPRSIPGSLRAAHPGPDGQTGTPDDILGSPGVVLNNADGSLAWSSVFGLREQVTGRRAPSYLNAAYAPLLFWDGRAGQVFNDPVTGATVLASGGALESQAVGPPVATGEMGHIGRDWNDVAVRVAASTPLALSASIPADLAGWIGSRGYPALFEEAFGTPEVTPTRIALAIATYERTQFSNQTPFDSVIAGLAVLTAAENAGRQLFGQLPCARCHAGALTSDNAFHYIGVRPVGDDSGRAAVTLDPADLGAFKTPTLRNVALRAAFMHDGRFSTLEQVVDFYDRGGDFSAPNKDPLIRPLGLTPLQKSQLVAFLSRPLTDPRVAAGTAPFDRPSLYGDSGLVPYVLEGGVPGATGTPPVPVALEPPLAGNPGFTVGVYGAPGGAEAVLVIDDAEPTAFGGIPASGSFARLTTTLAGSGDGGGYGSVTLAIPDDPALYGRSLYGRWYVTDPAASGGVAASPAFHMNLFGAHGEMPEVVASVPGASAAGTLRLYAGEPNPFRPSTTIRFYLPTASAVRLIVYDVTGRLVRRLVDSPMQAPGAHSVVWDGRDESDRSAPGGMYFYRLESERESQTSRVVRLD